MKLNSKLIFLNLRSNYGCWCPKNNFDLNKIDFNRHFNRRSDSDSTRTTGNPIQSFFVSTNLPEFTRVKTVDWSKSETNSKSKSKSKSMLNTKWKLKKSEVFGDNHPSQIRNTHTSQRWFFKICLKKKKSIIKTLETFFALMMWIFSNFDVLTN